MRKKLIASAVAVAIALVLLLPLSMMMEHAKSHADQTAEALVKPVLDIHNQVIADAAQAGAAVGGLIELEDAWAIEDIREESWDPLVTQMVNGGDVLGFDRESNTFYCTLGLETGEAWPELKLAAKNVPDGIEIRLVDDYTYDWCADAIREGYRYELLAYTDTQFSYFGLVFTGLPLVSLHTDPSLEMTDEYIPARAAVSAQGFEPIDSAAKVHLRGGGFTKSIDKKSYRVEFHTINEKGRDKQKDVSLLDMEADSDWLLIGNPSDVTGVRNHLCWDLWRKWNPKGDVPGYLDSKLVEVFLNDEYLGLYQLMQRYDIDEEIERMGGNLNTDYVYRVIREMNVDKERPAVDYQQRALFHIELRRKPDRASVDKAFELIEDYVLMNHMQNPIGDEEFARLVKEHIDVEELMRYYLFHQAADLSDDNVYNNLYVWMKREKDGGYTYRLSPWDMDFGLTVRSWEEGKEDQMCLMMPLPRRILDMNIGGSRQIIWDLWNQVRSGMLSDDGVYQWIGDLEEMVNASGAYLRDSEKWYGAADTLDLSQMTANEVAHMATIERHMREMWPLEDAAQ